MKRLLILVTVVLALLTGCNNPRADEPENWYLPWTWGDKTLQQSIKEGCQGGAITTTIAGSVYPCPSTTPAATPTAPAPTPTPTTQAHIPEVPAPICPTEAEFSQLTGVVADKVPTEPCAFHWRGDPLAITPKDACPDGWSCQIGVVGTGNVLYYGGSPRVTIYAATWRLVPAYPATDAVQQPCQFLAKSQEEGRYSVPEWTISPGNFTCP